MKYDIFISYRRKGGAEKARPLKSELERRGYRVFLDFDELKDGVFDQRIMEAIDEAPIFLVILSAHSLDRCINEDDWVRKEIEYAVKKNRHFVPVNPDKEFEGFSVDIPESIREGVGQHQFSHIDFEQLFMASIDKMVSERIEPLLAQMNRTSSSKGALVEIYSDFECRVLDFGEEIGTISKGKNEIRLPKGNHEIAFVGIESNKDRFDYGKLDVRDLEYVTRINVRLLDQYNARKAEEKRREEERRRREEDARQQAIMQEKLREEQRLREQRMKEELAKAAIRKKRMWIAGLILVAIIGCYGIIRHSQAKKAEQIRIAEQKRIAAEKAVQDSIALQKRIIAERAENKRKAEQKRIAAEKAEKERAAEQKRAAEEKAVRESGKGINGVYKVGYYYDDGKKQGVVFEVSADGKHGKIVHLKQYAREWCKDANELNVASGLGANDRANGARNTYLVKNRKNWQQLYPCHAWCLSIGFGWYMPAIDEVASLYKNKSLVNEMLSTKGGAVLASDYGCWSSTEYDRQYAYVGEIYKGQYRSKHISKRTMYGVYGRAVAAF